MGQNENQKMGKRKQSYRDWWYFSLGVSCNIFIRDIEFHMEIKNQLKDSCKYYDSHPATCKQNGCRDCIYSYGVGRITAKKRKKK